MRISEIQGLRALAVLLVMAFHAKFLPGGFIGVDVFYVISGYLITGLLLRELTETGSISLRNFYTRRIKRLLPSTFLVLVSTAIFSFIVMPPSARANLGRNIVATSLYVSNYLFAWWQNDYQNLGATPSPYIHFWSLAVEEQFYLFWPLLILLVGRGARIARVFKTLAWVSLASFALSLFVTEHWPIWSFYSLPTRAWELGIGALVVFYKEKEIKQKWIAWIALAMILYAAFSFNESTPFPGSAALLPTLGTAFLLYNISSLPKSIALLFRTRLVQWIGDVSYPLYLWHWPVLVLPLYVLNAPLSSVQRLLCIGLTFALAGLTHRFVENPFRHARAPFRMAISVAMVATLVATSLGFGISFSSAQNLKINGIVGSSSLQKITRTPVIYADGCQVGKTATSSPPCVYGNIHGAKTIVLFGDSHAAQWFPTLNAIAIKNDLKLVVLTKSSCPAVSVQLPDQGAFRNAPCQMWRENSLLRIKKLHPWAVFMSSFDHYKPATSVSNPASWWRQGMAVTVDRVRAITSHAILLQDTPWPNRDIPSCLSQKTVQSCTTSRPASQPWISQSFSKTASVIDPVDWFCKQTCPALLGGIVVYRDSTHMTVDFALHLVPLLSKTLVAKGIIGG